MIYKVVDSSVALRTVDTTNWREVTKIEVAPDQRVFVADPSYYLALCCYEIWNPLAIYIGDQVIGFMMWAIDDEDQSCWLGGILIDIHYQKRGYGKQAVTAAIAMLAQGKNSSNFALSYSPSNIAAKQLYNGLGFVETGELEDEEVVARKMVG